VKKRVQLISADVMKFNRALAKVKASEPTGVTENEIVAMAVAIHCKAADGTTQLELALPATEFARPQGRTFNRGGQIGQNSAKAFAQEQQRTGALPGIASSMQRKVKAVELRNAVAIFSRPDTPADQALKFFALARQQMLAEL